MIATLGARVEIWVYDSPADRQNRVGGAAVQAVGIDNGPPPKTVACWARTLAGQWLLVRKGRDLHRYEAVAGEIS